MTISATSQGLKPGVCTSSNRPANPFDGMMIYETDTDKTLVWNGSAWYANWNSAWGLVALTSSQTSSASIGTTETTMLTSPSFTAIANRYYKLSYYEPFVQPSNPAPGYMTFRIRLTNTSGAVYQYADIEPVGAGIDGQMIHLQIITTLSAGSTVIVGTGKSSSNTFLAYGGSSLGATRQLIVEDIGPA